MSATAAAAVAATKTVSLTEMPMHTLATATEECVEHSATVVTATPNGNTIFSSSATSNSTNNAAAAASASTTTQTSIEAAGEQQTNSNNSNNNNNNSSNCSVSGNASKVEHANAKDTLINNNNNNSSNATTTNGQQQTTTTTTSRSATTTSTCSRTGIENVEDLKIVGHLKSIEQINEQRRIFLSQTISEQQQQQQQTKTQTQRVEANNNNNNNTNANAENGQRKNAPQTHESNGKQKHVSGELQSATAATQNKANVHGNGNNPNPNPSPNNQHSDYVSNGNASNAPTPHIIASPDNFDLTPTNANATSNSSSNANGHSNAPLTLHYATLPLVKTPPPSTPPPKPPMLSRTRSLNRGASVNSTTPTPTPTPTSPTAKAFTYNSHSSHSNTRTPTVPECEDAWLVQGGTSAGAGAGAITPTSTVTIVSSIVPEPRKVETIELRDLQQSNTKTKTQTQKPPEIQAAATTATAAATAQVATAAAATASASRAADVDAEDDADALAALRKAVVPMGRQQSQSQQQMTVVAVPPTAPAQPAADKPIATSHYERLIEELKCPGCASPMKAPVLLCRTGHSSCEQCTRVLMLCPLCREPYTDMRSLTVEALCSKAHFRCSNAAGGCTVRLHLDLLGWHEKQCIFKPMKCFMGRVWGDCQWSGREAYWKDHLMAEHSNKVFSTDTIDLIWNMGVKQKPLTGYYVFEVFDEMFNFYEIFDKERVLFTMTVTSTVKDKKYNFAYEVTMLDRDSDALAITQKFPVHSEYDNDILQDGTCVSVPLGDLAKFIDEDRLLHYRVRITEVKTPRKMKLAIRHSCPPNGHQVDYQQTRIEGVNLKNVPTDVILTRKFGADGPSSSRDSPNLSTGQGAGGGGGGASSSEDEIERIRRQYYNRQNSDSESDPELDAFIAKRWGTPQLHFNRKYLRNVPSDISSSEDGISQQKNGDTLGLLADQRKQVPDDRASISSTATNYRKRMTNSLRRSMRSLRVDFKSLTTKKAPQTVDKQQPETA